MIVFFSLDLVYLSYSGLPDSNRNHSPTLVWSCTRSTATRFSPFKT